MTVARAVLLAAGGTGGHLFPAIAAARELERRGHRVSLATDARGERFDTGISDSHRVRSGGSVGGAAARFGAGLAIGLGFVQAWRLLSRLRPTGAIGFGGYPSVPTMLAVVSRGVPSLIHEQNAVLGRANRLVARRVSAIAASFEDTGGLDPAERARTEVVGNPVRPAFAEMRARPAPEYAGGDGGIRLLVLGGSQGARVFADVVPAAFRELPEALRNRFRVAQQCRPEDVDRVRRAYREAGVAAELGEFFPDVAERMADARLVVARAGASTVAELAEVGRPAVLVPYPHATDDHQTANARAMEKGGGAWLVGEDAFDAASLASRLEDFARRPERLAAAAAAMRRQGGRDAARALVDRFERLFEAGRGEGGA